MSLGAAEEGVKSDRCATMLDRFLHHPSRYRHKVEFVEFCVKKVLFSGRDEDLVLREDFTEALKRHSGISFRCNKSFVQHLVAAGVRVIRVTRRRVKVYYYVGLRLLDGERRKCADFLDGGRPGNATQDSDTAVTKVGIQRSMPRSSSFPAPESSTNTTDLLAAKTSEDRHRTEPKNDPLTPLNSSASFTNPNRADISEGTPHNTALQKLINYPTLHKDRHAFIRFCKAKITFTGDLADFVFRKDLFEEFRKFLGAEKPCPIAVGRHLMSAGVMVTRLGSGEKREYAYRGLCFADGRDRKVAKVEALRTRGKSWSGQTKTQKQAKKSQGGRRQTQKKKPGKSEDRGRQTQKKKQLASTVQGHKGAPHAQPSDQGLFSTLNSPLHPPPSIPSPPFPVVPVPVPSLATFLPFTSSPILSQASTSMPLDLSGSSSAPLDLSTSAPTQTPPNQHQVGCNTLTAPKPHIPFASPFFGQTNLSTPQMASPNLPLTPPAHSHPQTPTITFFQPHVNLLQAVPVPMPAYTPVATIRLLGCVLAYLASRKMQEEINAFTDFSLTTAMEKGGEDGESN